ncbi:MAG: methionyl-tRNA formyltransferase [Bacteroidetes bacterium GWF2_43_63]|nr:MAG: methionyl-tRNA formyltransferase [Bacteroidetes bacterium GWE2_42_42]OFY54827.1 MAG: methionyl-tRNA formyltransferase [Bacteroidetes bacterium GWF2_43_63]HCB63273.1 methionyl-tRNA formyltransferase [Bacteroidales bacterium]HCY22015.1 methionyl-tRNA formyltransferase [Bacteroidales bacterium]
MMKIVYMGTPDFAVGPLEAIFKAGHEIAAIVTAPDKPAGRGRKLSSSEVKKFAEMHDLPLLQPVNLKESAFLSILNGIKPDVIVVIAFRMLPESVWRIPSKGTINLHASLLPQYRGAAPINWAIINGETQTGLSTFFINESIDTGDIIMQETTEISETDNFGTLHDRLKEMGKAVILNTLDIIESGSIKAISQGTLPYENKPAPKLNKENTRIDWSQNSKDIFNKIRGLSPFPGAWTILVDKDGNEQLLKVSDSCPDTTESGSQSTGAIITDGKTYIHVVCGLGKLQVNKLQLSGRSSMSTAEFLRGYAGLLDGAFLK